SPQSFCAINRATSSKGVLGVQHAGSGVITSRANLAIGSPSCPATPEATETERSGRTGCATVEVSLWLRQRVCNAGARSVHWISSTARNVAGCTIAARAKAHDDFACSAVTGRQIDRLWDVVGWSPRRETR